MKTTDFEASTFQNRPAYRYIRASDALPTYEDLPEEGAVCKVKLFNPTGIGTWFIASYDPDTRVAYGVAKLHETEAGTVSMAELVEYRGRFGLPIERDLHWQPKTMEELMQ